MKTIYLTALIPLLLLSCGAESPIKFSDEHVEDGFIVSVYDTLLYDHSREREIPLRVYYPGNKKGKSPLIILSHGLGASNESYSYLGTAWAGKGYIVAVPTHHGSDYDYISSDSGAFLRAAADPENTVLRPMDMIFVLDRLLDGSVNLVRKKVDKRRIGAAGHSYGAYTALALAGQTTVYNDETRCFRDKRVKAVIAMSTQVPGTLGLTEDSWDNVKIPVLTMTGTDDFGIGVKDPSDRRYVFEKMPPGKKYHVTIQGASHLTFQDNVELGNAEYERDPRHHELIIKSTTLFWDSFLRGNKNAREIIDSDSLMKETGGFVEIERKD